MNDQDGSNVIVAMVRRNVPPLPRNYELFYEALHGNNRSLVHAISALCTTCSQEQLDAIYDEYLRRGSAQETLEEVQTKLTQQTASLIKLLSEEHETLEHHSDIIHQANMSLPSPEYLSSEGLCKTVELMQSSTQAALTQHANLAGKASKTSDELQTLRRELNEYKKLANLDSLTGIYNRRAYDSRLDQIYSHKQKHGVTALILIDIDHFKRLNDQFGHLTGDKVLISVATFLKALSNEGVFVARHGGEEFALIVEPAPLNKAMKLAENVRNGVELLFGRTAAVKGETGQVTVSVGVAVSDEAETRAELYRNADMALYAAKAAGRNCTRAYEPALEGDMKKGWLLYQQPPLQQTG